MWTPWKPQQNPDRLQIKRVKTSKAKKRLLGIKAVGEHLLKHPIMPTQEAGRFLAQPSGQTDDDVKRRHSIRIYEVLIKQLNLLQIYI